jgi:hypothetical protein
VHIFIRQGEILVDVISTKSKGRKSPPPCVPLRPPLRLERLRLLARTFCSVQLLREARPQTSRFTQTTGFPLFAMEKNCD